MADRSPKAAYSSTNGDGFTDEEVEFLKAMERYKREHHRPFPTWREVLLVVESLGYRKIEEPQPLPKVRE
ncbi:MAG TPA: hypothetical protein VKS79_21105 [Gemmataceae bacterium]|nr:hypothetical protein [Gemmataceae bacterium]